MDQILETPTLAWKFICDNGGLELDGRDDGLDEKVRQILNPLAHSLEEALESATMEAFLNAFFASLFPYIQMFQDILDFFEKGNATKGKEHWTLKVGELNLNLDHFREFLEGWGKSVRVIFEVPGIDVETGWKVEDTIRQEVDSKGNIWYMKPSDFPAEFGELIADINNDIYPHLPRELMPNQIDKRLSVISSIITAKLGVLGAAGIRNREGLMMVYQTHQREQTDRSDAFEFSNVLQAEHDFWLRSAIKRLSLATQLTNDRLDFLANEIDILTRPFAPKPFHFKVSVKDVESILSLPIWKQRYELYAIWIAAEIIRALEKHDIEIHHDGGAIRFDFKETILATIESSPGPFRLICEKKIPLDNPSGKSRTANVQPDHQLWTSSFGQETCKMAIEVKHYKKSAKGKFVEVFNDYARAINHGNVYLVNHGPIGSSVLAGVDTSLKQRCYSIGFLEPTNHSARGEFAAAVRKCVGEPIRPGTLPINTGLNIGAFLFDVSGSMKSFLESELVRESVSRIASVEKPVELVAADTEIVGRFEVSPSGFESVLSIKGGHTDLQSSMNELLASHEAVLLLTDGEGVSTLEGISIEAYNLPDIPDGLEVRLCKRLLEN